MKKQFLALFVAIAAFSTVASAQGFHFGVKGGANMVKIDNQAFKDGFKFGYNLGAFAEINFSKKLGIQPEVLWAQSAYKTATGFNQVVPGGLNDLDVKLNYLQIPLLLSYRPSKLLTFQAGPQYSILINQDKSLLQNGGDAFKSGDLSMLAGAQLNILGLKAGARYAIGLSNINDITSSTDWKSRGWQVYVGFRIL